MNDSLKLRTKFNFTVFFFQMRLDKVVIFSHGIQIQMKTSNGKLCLMPQATPKD